MNCNSKRHLFIAGTGRAGTSFLVRYLHALGLETHISQSGEGQWHVAANAGLEDAPLVSPSGALPYVVKAPWISEFIDQLIADETIAIDALIIPVRDLRDAASSRIILELRNIYETADWMTSYEETWRHWGLTAGGAIFSLDPVDQERILAVGFARLVQSLVKADLPVVFLDFPRIIEDADYLFDKLRPYLPATADRDAAREKHRGVADPGKVRVGQERSVAQPPGPSDMPAPNAETDRGAAFHQLDLIALRREIARRKQELKGLVSAGQQIAALEHQHSVSAQRIAELESQRAALARQVAESESQNAALSHAAGELQRHNRELLRSGSWRLTRPFRSIAKRVKWIAGK